MTGYLERYKRSHLYRSYLRHGIWTWERSKGFGVFSVFPFGIFMGTWWMLVHLPAVILGIGIANFTGFPQFELVVFSIFISFIIFLPIAVGVMCEIIPGYFACLSLTFGNKAPANRLQGRHQQELAAIENAL